MNIIGIKEMTNKTDYMFLNNEAYILKDGRWVRDYDHKKLQIIINARL